MKGRVLSALVLFLAGCGGTRTDSLTPTPSPTPARKANAFGAFNFTIPYDAPGDQVRFLASFGYTGVMFGYEATRLAAFAAAPEVADGRFRVMAVLIGLDGNRDVEPTSLFRALDEIARAGALPCLRVQPSAGRPMSLARTVEVVQEVADIAATVNGGKGTDVVLYPHAGETMVDAETALAVRHAAVRSNVKVSLHLCHELKAGHHERLSSVIAAVAPELALVTINGADVAQDTAQGSWFHFIRPLAAGDLDVETLYLRPLLDHGYAGPIVLHTFELREPPDVHFPQSMTRWRDMSAAYGLAPE